MAVKERLEAAKASSTRFFPSSGIQSTGAGGFSINTTGPRIAKPLRGGGGAATGDGSATESAVAGFQAQEAAGKRGSGGWFFQGRGS